MTIDDNNPSSGDFDDDDSFALENLEHYPGDLSAFIEVTPSKAEVPATAPADDDLSAFPMDSTATVTPDAEESSFHADVRALETESEAAFGADAPHDAATDDLSPEEEIDTDDFVRQLQADLERSKAKKAAQTSQADIQQAAEPVKKIEFTSVEDLPGAEEIDLSSIEAHHPSTYRQMEEAPEEEIPAFDSLPDEADTGTMLLTAEEALATANGRTGATDLQSGGEQHRPEHEEEIDADSVFAKLKSLKSNTADDDN